MPLPLLASDEIVRALLRLGFTHAHTRGSHATYHRPRARGGTDIAVVPLNRKQVARGTLRSILDISGVSVDELLDALC
jgi:predicted RNA binding protein YcfA (HicA-like mRNA interferase family)